MTKKENCLSAPALSKLKLKIKINQYLTTKVLTHIKLLTPPQVNIL